uniref:Uncharacterized protein n=1 Tax=Plectus sambesii TaxID=2011161 RepID=A0A914VEG0_9BILA
MMFVNCMKTSDPGMYPAMTSDMLTTCTTTMSFWPKWTNTSYPEVVDHLFKRVGAEMTTFMSFFPANSDFTQCIMDAFTMTKR